MSKVKNARDPGLLDLLEAHEGVSFEGDVWRVAGAGRDPLAAHPAQGRWDMGTTDVLYFSFESGGALAESWHRFSRQPVFPTKNQSVLHRMTLNTSKSQRLADLPIIAELQISAETIGKFPKGLAQEIGEAAHFLGFAGIIVPSAHWPCQNLILFADKISAKQFTADEAEPIEWTEWRKSRRR